jgi:hypothetical protein
VICLFKCVLEFTVCAQVACITQTRVLDSVSVTTNTDTNKHSTQAKVITDHVESTALVLVLVLARCTLCFCDLQFSAVLFVGVTTAAAAATWRACLESS